MPSEDLPTTGPPSRLTTADRILEGALRVFGRRGVEGLSMREISSEAGVSRGTIYRYYKTREELIAAAARYDQKRFNTGARAVLEDNSAGPEQLRALLFYVHSFLTDHPSRWMVSADPVFLLEYLDERIPEMASTLSEVLRPALERSAIVRSGHSTVEAVADLIIRWAVSIYLLPAGDSEAPLEAIAALITATDDFKIE